MSVGSTKDMISRKISKELHMSVNERQQTKEVSRLNIIRYFRVHHFFPKVNRENDFIFCKEESTLYFQATNQIDFPLIAWPRIGVTSSSLRFVCDLWSFEVFRSR